MIENEDIKTRSELIKAIKKPGKVFVTMVTKYDVVRVSVEKASLLE